jgi:hypothetical protein
MEPDHSIGEKAKWVTYEKYVHCSSFLIGKELR